MKFKKILALTIILSSTLTLYSCSNSNVKDEVSTKESNTVENSTSSESNQTKEDDSNTSKPTTASPKEQNTNTNTNTNSNANTDTNINTSKPAQDNSLTYKSNLGFSITFPSDWKNRYAIKEDDNSMYVYFKSSDPNTPKNSGLLFFIKKIYDQNDENMSDSIFTDGHKHITVGNKTYLVGGPTDIGLSENNSDFKIYLSAKKECESAVNTIKP